MLSSRQYLSFSEQKFSVYSEDCIDAILSCVFVFLPADAWSRWNAWKFQKSRKLGAQWWTDNTHQPKNTLGGCELRETLKDLPNKCTGVCKNYYNTMSKVRNDRTVPSTSSNNWHDIGRRMAYPYRTQLRHLQRYITYYYSGSQLYILYISIPHHQAYF